MAQPQPLTLPQLIIAEAPQIRSEWLDSLRQLAGRHTGRLKEAELQAQAQSFFEAFRAAVESGGIDTEGGAYVQLKDMLGGMSRARALQGFTPTDTATFVL